jgi:hypothetical protein
MEQSGDVGDVLTLARQLGTAVMALVNPAQQLVRHMMEISQSFQQKVDAVLATLPPDLDERMADDLRCVGEAGWLLGRVTPYEVSQGHELLLAQGPQALDKWAVGRLGCGREFDLLERDLLASFAKRRLRPWKRLVTETVWAYRNHRYGLVIQSALSAVEGVVARITFGVSVTETRPVSLWQQATRGRGKLTLDRGLISSVEGFLSGWWQRRWFDQGRPPDPSRHWVVHGRDTTCFTKANALRLLLALDTLAGESESVLSRAKPHNAYKRPNP